MRGVLAAAVCLALLAGCTSSRPDGDRVDPEFLRMAKAAPELLKADMGVDGELARIDGAIEVTMQITADGRQMDMDATVDFEQVFYTGGGALTKMDMGIRAPEMGMVMDMTMRMLCTPEEIHIRVEAMGETTEETMENPAGSCDEDALATELAELDDDERRMVEGMLKQDGFTDVEFSHVRTDLGEDYAVYKTSFNFGQAGMDAVFEVTSTATLDDGRIAQMDLEGTLDMDLDQGGRSASMHAELTGAMDFHYGDRDPLPVDLA
jgi:hypothetical protein